VIRPAANKNPAEVNLAGLSERWPVERLLAGLVQHLGEACVGQVSEVFDAERPFAPRGCVAQAWGVAEMIRVMAR